MTCLDVLNRRIDIFRENNSVIDYRPYNLIIPIPTIEDKIGGGSAAVCGQFDSGKIQQDEYMIAIGLKNATEVRDAMQILESVGLKYDAATSRSKDFTVLAKEGIWWEVPWLIFEDGKAWFIADVEAPV